MWDELQFSPIYTLFYAQNRAMIYPNEIWAQKFSPITWADFLKIFWEIFRSKFRQHRVSFWVYNVKQNMPNRRVKCFFYHLSWCFRMKRLFEAMTTLMRIVWLIIMSNLPSSIVNSATNKMAVKLVCFDMCIYSTSQMNAFTRFYDSHITKSARYKLHWNTLCPHKHIRQYIWLLVQMHTHTRIH